MYIISVLENFRKGLYWAIINHNAIVKQTSAILFAERESLEIKKFK